MISVVEGRDLPRIKTNELPEFVPEFQYVRPDRHYEYVCKRNFILVSNEVFMISAANISYATLCDFPRDTEYFVFYRSYDKKWIRLIEQGIGVPVTLDEARKIHDHLIQEGMCCVFTRITDNKSRNLYNNLVARQMECRSSSVRQDINNLLKRERFLGEIRDRYFQHERDDDRSLKRRRYR